MVTRDILAAALISAGIASVSWGASLLTPAAGFVALGVQLGILGLALGFGEGTGESDEGGDGLAAEADSAPPAPAAFDSDLELEAALDDELDDELDDADRSRLLPFTARPPVNVPLGNYLGIRSKEEAG